jgi:hypothetical protein
MKPSTPKEVTPSIREFLKDIGLQSEPIYLKFTNMSPIYSQRYCLDNCEMEQARSKCEIVYGWVIWEEPETYFVEAEYHSVVNINGELIDITPRIDGEKNILFVQDLSRKPTRINYCTWKTWSNIKSIAGQIYENTECIAIVDKAKLVLK